MIGLLLGLVAALVSTVPASNTPVVDVGSFDDSYQVFDLTPAGDLMYVCGQFTAIDGLPRLSVAAFDQNTMEPTSFAPTVWMKGGEPGKVNRCLLSPDRTMLILAGEFNVVNGWPRENLAAVSVADGSLIEDWRYQPSGRVLDAAMARGRLIIAGASLDGANKHLMSVRPNTGVVDDWLRLSITGTLGDKAGDTKITQLEVSPDETELVAAGNFTHVDGYARRQLFKLDLTGPMEVQPWRARDSMPAYAPICQHRPVVNDIDYNRTGSRFTVVGTGGPKDGMCDRTIRYDSEARGGAVPAIWINRTCGDTLTAVLDAGRTIYIQGHQKCVEAVPGGRRDFVVRNGMAALHPGGKVYRGWRSDQPRCVGGAELQRTKRGLWSGIDCKPGMLLRIPE